MNFTSDWFSPKIPYWERVISKVKKGPWNCLEIGSYEGRSSCWILENLPDSRLTCVDTFEGSVEHTDIQKTGIYERFMDNTKEWKDRLTVLRGQSDIVVRAMKPEPTYDFIYIDGSHEGPDVLTDIVLCWKLLKSGGLCIFDDYNLYPGVTDSVNCVMHIYKSQVKEVHGGYDQLLIIKA